MRILGKYYDNCMYEYVDFVTYYVHFSTNMKLSYL